MFRRFIEVKWLRTGTIQRFLQSWHQTGAVQRFLQSWHQRGAVQRFLQSWHQAGAVQRFLLSWHQTGAVQRFLTSWHQTGAVQRFFQSWHQTGYLKRHLIDPTPYLPCSMPLMAPGDFKIAQNQMANYANTNDNFDSNTHQITEYVCKNPHLYNLHLSYYYY